MKNEIYFRKREAAAFTQVELLVLVVVVAMMTMLGLSAASKLSNQSKIAQCSNNLRQLNLAHLLYAADNSDNLPVVAGGLANWPWDVPVPVATALSQYGGLVPKTMYCPGTAPRFTDEQNFAAPSSLWNFGGTSFRIIGYALTVGTSTVSITNRNSSTVPQPSNVGPFPTPAQPASQRVLTADANLSPEGVNFTAIFGGYSYNGASYPHICPHLDGAQPAGGNVGMLDGHVEWRPFKQMVIRTSGASPNFYW